jgi:hypothetical protein
MGRPARSKRRRTASPVRTVFPLGKEYFHEPIVRAIS